MFTSLAAPSGPPENVTEVWVSSSSLWLEWRPPSEDERNGVITGYRLLLEREGGQEVRVHTPNTHYNFTGLQQSTTYYYAIAAETSEGTGPFSNRTSVLTLAEETTMYPNTQTTGTEVVTTGTIGMS